LSAVTKNERPEESPQERRSDVALNRLRLNPLNADLFLLELVR